MYDNIYYAKNKVKFLGYAKKYRESHKEQVDAYRKKYREEHKESEKTYHQKWEKDHREHRNILRRKYLNKLRIQVLSKLGNKCCKCGFDDPRALQVDHINGGGVKHRKEVVSAYLILGWLKRNNYPKGFQILCANCKRIKELDLLSNRSIIKV